MLISYITDEQRMAIVEQGFRLMSTEWWTRKSNLIAEFDIMPHNRSYHTKLSEYVYDYYFVNKEDYVKYILLYRT